MTLNNALFVEKKSNLAMFDVRNFIPTIEILLCRFLLVSLHFSLHFESSKLGSSSPASLMSCMSIPIDG